MGKKLSIHFIMVSENHREGEVRFGEGRLGLEEGGKIEEIYDTIGNMIIADYREGIITTIYLPEEGEM
jgi:hypothetical protein